MAGADGAETETAEGTEAVKPIKDDISGNDRIINSGGTI